MYGALCMVRVWHAQKRCAPMHAKHNHVAPFGAPQRGRWRGQLENNVKTMQGGLGGAAPSPTRAHAARRTPGAAQVGLQARRARV